MSEIDWSTKYFGWMKTLKSSDANEYSDAELLALYTDVLPHAAAAKLAEVPYTGFQFSEEQIRRELLRRGIQTNELDSL